MTAKNGKPCKKCGGHDWERDGRHCRPCEIERWQQWQKDNKKKHYVSVTKWRSENPDKVAEYDHVHKTKSRERSRIGSRKRYWENPEAARNKAKEYRDNPNNRGKRTAAENTRRNRKAGNGGSYTAAEWQALCNHYGNKCLRCGRDDEKLTADHILPITRGGGSDIGNIQPLCLSCNVIKYNKHIDYRPDAGPLRWIQAKLFG